MKSFKKTVCLAMAIIFALAPMVSAAEICPTCKSNNNELIYSKDQGNCTGIIYENTGDRAQGAFSREGYNRRSQTTTPKVILDLCNCPNSHANYKTNKILGLRFTIMTEGVYWTNEQVAIQPFAGFGAACDAPYGATKDVSYQLNPANPLTYGDIAKNADGKVGTVYMDRTPLVNGQEVASPGYGEAGDAVLAYLRDITGTTDYTEKDWNYTDAATVTDPYNTSAVNGQRSRELTKYEYYLAGRASQVAIGNVIKAESTPSCTINAAQRAQIIEISNAYQIGMMEDKYKLCKWWVDLPEMRKDNDVVQPMSELKVKIEVIGEDPGGLCATSQAICSCTITLGIFGADKFTMYFPYVLTQSDPWTSGIAVTNLGTTFTSIDDMEATFTLTDSTGKEFKYIKEDFESVVWTGMIDTLLDKFTGGTPAAGAAWLKVEANFPVDGYEFISDGVFGAGTQPRIYDNWRLRSGKVYEDPFTFSD